MASASVGSRSPDDTSISPLLQSHFITIPGVVVTVSCALALFSSISLGAKIACASIGIISTVFINRAFSWILQAIPPPSDGNPKGNALTEAAYMLSHFFVVIGTALATMSVAIGVFAKASLWVTIPCGLLGAISSVFVIAVCFFSETILKSPESSSDLR